MQSLLAIFLIALRFFAHAQNKPHYKLVWSDEFNKDGSPNSSNWTYETGFVRNEELQWYQPANAYCENGYLIIEARRETKPNPNYVEGSSDWRKNRPSIQYTSACLITRRLHSWMYGRFEMRARIDISKGVWPAWWTLGIDKRWPANGEIDIMEYYKGQLLANVACLGTDGKPKWFSTRKSVDSLGGANWSSKFHIWKMDWTKEFISLYVDDMLLNKVSLDSLVNNDTRLNDAPDRYRDGQGSDFNPFKQPHYMLLNLAIGGTAGGDPAATSFPRKFEVDYVRVYQIK